MDGGELRINTPEEWQAFLDSFGPLPPPHDYSKGPSGYVNDGAGTVTLLFDGGGRVHQWVGHNLDLIWNLDRTEIVGVVLPLRAVRAAGLAPIGEPSTPPKLWGFKIGDSVEFLDVGEGDEWMWSPGKVWGITVQTTANGATHVLLVHGEGRTEAIEVYSRDEVRHRAQGGE